MSARAEPAGGRVGTGPAGGVLRAMTWRDIPALAALETEIFGPEAWSERTWWSELAERPRRCYVVLDGPEGRVRGYAGLDHAGETADVMTIAVAPAGQGRGAGCRLLTHLVAVARSRGAAHLLLEVRADNHAARRLYERLGFTLIHTRRRYYRPDGVDALVMRADLDPGRPVNGEPGRQGASR